MKCSFGKWVEGTDFPILRAVLYPMTNSSFSPFQAQIQKDEKQFQKPKFPIQKYKHQIQICKDQIKQRQVQLQKPKKQIQEDTMQFQIHIYKAINWTDY